MVRPSPIFPEYTIGDFINEPGNPTQFEITRFETMAEPEVEDIHKHTFYEILWVDAGTSVQHIDYKEYDLREGSLFLISPDRSFSPIQTPHRRYHFAQEFYRYSEHFYKRNQGDAW